ncbi:MAG: NAD(P)/FAD-dependent oxidoreductase [Halodesulfurarchaeum sp.]
MTDHDVVVIGAGLAGLETARLLAAEDVPVTVFEASSMVGGRVRTDRQDGFTFDRGFQVLFTAYPEARRALDYEALDLRRFPPGAVVCRPNRRGIVADPFRDPRHAVETALSTEITWGDKFELLRLRRALRDRSRANIYAGPDETIASFLRARGFSDRFLDSFAGPFYGGITLDRSLETSSRVFQFTFRMLSEGDTVIPADGMDAIPQQLARRAREQGARIETDARVEEIAGEGPVQVELADRRVSAKAVVVAAGPGESARLTGLEAIPNEGRGVHTQYFRLPAGNPLADRKHIHLNAAGPVPNQVVSLSAVAPSYAPDGEALVAASTNMDASPEPSTLAARTREVMGRWYPEAAFEEAELLETVSVPFAQYAQPPGSHETLPDVTSPPGDVFLAGDVTTDASINGALRSGRFAAEALQRADLEVGT